MIFQLSEKTGILYVETVKLRTHLNKTLLSSTKTYPPAKRVIIPSHPHNAYTAASSQPQPPQLQLLFAAQAVLATHAVSVPRVEQ